jgi:hypothetical protein
MIPERVDVSHLFDAELFMARSWKLCNTIEMTLGRVPGLVLGSFLTLETIEKRDLQSFESASGQGAIT